MADEKEKMNAGSEPQDDTELLGTHASRKKKNGLLKKIVVIALTAILVLGGAGALIVNHFFNRIQKIDLSTETTLSPEEFWALIGITTAEDASNSLESDIATEPETTEPETTEPETTETETEVESATEETERLIMLDPDATEYVAIEETTTTAAPTTKWVPPATQAPMNYNWVKAPGLGDEYLINILLIGDDSRVNSQTARSDTILLLSINPNKNKASLISFMRDMYVPIHDGYGYSRINHAYEAGGIGFLTQCLQNNFGLHIDGVVKINFWGFAQAVDALGGVDISLNANEVKMVKDTLRDYTGKGMNFSAIHEGSCHLDGNAALAYCRIRKLDNDYNRTARQRKMLSTLFNKFKNSGVGTVTNVANTVLSSCYTTMTNGSMAGYVAQLAPKAGAISLGLYRLPAEGTFRDVVIGGMQVLQSDQNRNIAALKGYLPW